VYPLERMAEVQQLMEDGKTHGKVVFAIGGQR